MISFAQPFSYVDFQNKVIPFLDSVPTFDCSHEDLRTVYLDERGVLRNHFLGHFTTSCIVFDPSFNLVLAVHHKKYNEWIYPGGHADGDWLWARSALREVSEETGLHRVLMLPRKRILDVNDSQSELHEDELLPWFVQKFEVPAIKKDPPHQHFDMVFGCVATTANVIHQPEESLGIQWISKEFCESVSSGKEEMVDNVSKLTAGIFLRGWKLLEARLL